MTAEIAVMNKEAIALAADSAVTASREGGHKIFNSANKLFALSKCHPVGVMVYGNATLMDVPWETVIKVFRNKLGSSGFPTLQVYADSFFSFLSEEKGLFSEKDQNNYLFGNAIGYFSIIRDEIEKEKRNRSNKGEKIDDQHISIIAENVIKKHLDRWVQLPILPCIPKNHADEIIRKYQEPIEKAIRIIFEGFSLSQESRDRLGVICSSLFSKDEFPDHKSGIVIAGFGEKEIFPSFQSYFVQGVVNNTLKYKLEGGAQSASYEMAAGVFAFAQGDMATSFMEGLEPDIQEFLESYLGTLFSNYPEIIIASISKYDEREKDELRNKLKQGSKDALGKFFDSFHSYRNKKHVEPIINVVGMLPKEDLAAMAESLVALTSFKRKISLDAETVAGPIDVAVISKGDGFVWIKRKHYFKPELNPQFFSNYYRR